MLLIFQSRIQAVATLHVGVVLSLELAVNRVGAQRGNISFFVPLIPLFQKLAKQALIPLTV